MARNNLTCDVCRQPCQRVAAKLFLAPIKEGETRKTHSSYTGHADVGECCAEKIVKQMKWQKRGSRPRKKVKST